jgi:hypothetical protein
MPAAFVKPTPNSARRDMPAGIAGIGEAAQGGPLGSSNYMI